LKLRLYSHTFDCSAAALSWYSSAGCEPLIDEQDPDDGRWLQSAPGGAEAAEDCRPAGDNPGHRRGSRSWRFGKNAEYHAARDRQSFIEGRLAEIEDKIARAEVIDVSKLSGSAIKFGAKVRLADEETDEEQTFQIVGEDEADISQGLLSVTSPLARALIGKRTGESVEVATPRGAKSYGIVTVAFG
jgi:transcription elongation factor GreA